MRAIVVKSRDVKMKERRDWRREITVELPARLSSLNLPCHAPLPIRASCKGRVVPEFGLIDETAPRSERRH